MGAVRSFQGHKGARGIDLTKRACSMNHSGVFEDLVCAGQGVGAGRAQAAEAMWMRRHRRSLPSPWVPFPLLCPGLAEPYSSQLQKC